MTLMNLGYYKIEYHTFYKPVKTEAIMDKKLLRYLILGVIFTFLGGTLLHFTYEWSGNNFWVGLFSPVNESSWEHMKLLFFPMLLYHLVSCILFRRTPSAPDESILTYLRNNYPCICLGNALGILIGTISIPVFFYTYSGILGTHFLFLDIAIFLCSAILGFACTYWTAQKCQVRKYAGLIYSALVLLALCFFVFTVFPPDLGIFTSVS